jgi:hypothetical protein
MQPTPVDHHALIQVELHRRNLSVTPQALNALVSTVTKASPEIAGDTDSLLLGLLTSGSYTVDLLQDSGANIAQVLASADSSAGQYESRVQRDDFDPVAALFGPQANIATLFDRAEFETRPIEASDILQHAVTPVADYFEDGEWIEEQEAIGHEGLSRLRIYTDLELLVKECFEALLDTIWKSPERVLRNRIQPLRNNEILSLRRNYGVNEQFLPCVVDALNKFIRYKKFPFDDARFIAYAAQTSYMTTLGAEQFLSCGGDYNALAATLRLSARFAPERDQPILALAEQDGRILVRTFTYRGTAAVSAGLSNPLLSVSAQSLPLIQHYILEEFESLINRPRIREQEIQNFLELHPEILRSLGYSRCVPHVMLSEAGKREMIPDFILHRPGGNGFDILDLKLPTGRIAVSNPYDRVSHEISRAVGQLKAYSDYFKSPVNRERFTRAHQIEYFEPKLIVAIGRQSQYSSNEMRSGIEAQVPGVRILTYDELVSYARTRAIQLS